MLPAPLLLTRGQVNRLRLLLRLRRGLLRRKRQPRAQRVQRPAHVEGAALQAAGCHRVQGGRLVDGPVEDVEDSQATHGARGAAVALQDDVQRRVQRLADGVLELVRAALQVAVQTVSKH